MIENRSELVEKAAERLGAEIKPLLNRLVECEGGDWYLREKIVDAPGNESRLDHTRPLKYAYNFLINGAEVRFVREEKARSPDLMVAVLRSRFYVEVKKFRMGVDGASIHQASKIVSAITAKRRQLPEAEMGFVAIDNFDLRLERGFRHDLIAEGLCEIERLARTNAEGWRRPSGVIVSAASAMGSGSVIGVPHFIWRNPYAKCLASDALLEWIRSSLPDGQIFDAPAVAAGISGDYAFES